MHIDERVAELPAARARIRAGWPPMLPTFATLVAVAIFVTAGNWQRARMDAKESLRAQLDAATANAPARFPQRVVDWTTWRFRPVTATGTFDTKNAGTGKTVNASGLSLSGGDAGNYNLTPTTATATADISKKDVSGNIAEVRCTADHGTHGFFSSLSRTLNLVTFISSTCPRSNAPCNESRQRSLEYGPTAGSHSTKIS